MPTLLLSVVVFAGGPDVDRPWDSFRGPDGAGVGPASEVSLDAPVWRTPILGRAWSSPVVLGDSAWLTTAAEDGTRMSVLRVRLSDGAVLLDRVVFENAAPDFVHPENTYASPTPVVGTVHTGRGDGEPAVFVHFGKYGTARLDPETGDTLWERRDFPLDHFRGPGSSPVLWGGTLFLPFDGFDAQYVAALDAATGETVWREDRGIEYATDNGDHRKAYGTPLAIEVGGEPQVVSTAAGATVSQNPRTGGELWRVKHGGMNSATVPQWDGRRVFVTTGNPSVMLAIDPAGHGDVTDTHVVWQSVKSVPQRPTPLLLEAASSGEAVLFAVTDDGIASTRDPHTGGLTGRGRLGGTFWSSPVLAGDRVWIFARDGGAFAFRPGEVEPTLTANIGAGVWATPAVLRDGLLVRTEHDLRLYGAGDE